ncbi:MAG: hypothetical protein Q9201_001329, partial [Fulgogasparrea decipioides]
IDTPTAHSSPSSAPAPPVFRIGDAVFALTAFERDGAAAEYILAAPHELARKPSNISHVEAATIPLSALTAWQALFSHARLQPGQRVLVLGATGGVGVMAVQLARWKGATVSATCGGRNTEFVRGLGADDEVFDYSKGWRIVEEGNEGKWDVVLDTVGGEWQLKAWNWVAEGGWLVSVHSPLDEEMVRREFELRGVKGRYFIVEPDGKVLGEIGKLVEKEAVRGVVDTVLGLEDGRRGFEKLEGGHVRGKVVLKAVD